MADKQLAVDRTAIAAKDDLYRALSVMCPYATDYQILQVIKALETYVNARVMEHMAL